MAHASHNRFRLADLCAVRVGLSVRGRLETGSEGDTPVVLLRDTSEGRVDLANLERANLGDVGERYRVGEGDILFRTRFEPNIAIHLAEFPGEAVVIAPLLAIRVSSPDLEPAYLAWYINQPPAQAAIARDAHGTNLRMIPRSALDGVEVPVPPLDAQRRIVAVAKLSERERTLATQIADKRCELTRFALLEQARKAQPH